MVIDLGFEDHLHGMSNYSIWKERIALVLEDSEIWQFVEQTQIPPTNATLMNIHKKKDMKSKRVILKGVKDHIIPNVSRKKIDREMWKGLTKLYQSDNKNWKLVLRHKFKSTKMSKTKIVSSYLT